jgi:tetratricopeptide (TPR) repeat protein
MNWLSPKIANVLELALCAGVVGWVMYRWLKKSDDPARLISKWVITAVMVSITWWVAARKIASSGGGMDYGTAFVVVIACAACGVVLGITWGSNIGEALGSPLASLFDGGDQEIVPQPFYSIAEAKRKQGKYLEAVAEIRKQLARFPGDFAGMLKLAEVQAENLNDLPGAQVTIERLLVECEPSSMNMGLALNRLADWHLKFGHDPDSARLALEQIIQMFPDTEQAYLAGQRIAHLMTPEMLSEKKEPHRIKVGQFQENIGLLREPANVRAPTEDPAVVAGELVEHLRDHPQDSEARERLALIYADHYQRLDMAVDQLEELIAQPNLPPKHATHWLNVLADLHIKHAGNTAAARAALQRVMDLFPASASAENAKNRMAHLELELRAKKTSQVVKLGSYEQNIGLKGRPGPPGITD